MCILGHVAQASWLSHCPGSVALIGMETPGNVAEAFWFDVLVHAGCPGDRGRVGELARFLRRNEFTAVAQLLRAGHPSEWLEAEGLSDAELQFVHQLGTSCAEQHRWAYLVQFACSLHGTRCLCHSDPGCGSLLQLRGSRCVIILLRSWG